jgi:RNA-directed DNA polymerase
MKSQSARLLAVRRVTQDNQGKQTAGIDGVKSVKPAERSVMADQIHPKNWKDISPPVRRVWIPKPGKTEKRPLGMPSIIDRIVQEIVRLVIEPILEAQFFDHSYGFRPMRDATHAVARVHYILWQAKCTYAVEGDIRAFFDQVNHNLDESQLLIT